MRIKFEIPTNTDPTKDIMTEGIGHDDMGEAYLSTSEAGCLVWETCWSGFHYTQLSVVGGKEVWEYKGAEAGFRAQNLLPLPLQAPPQGDEAWVETIHEGIEVLSVEGTYGTFEGRQALQKYKGIKEAWYSRLWPVFNASDTSGGWGFGGYCATKWKNKKPVYKTGKGGGYWEMTF